MTAAHPCALSKSKYCMAVQCPKMLWLKKNRPEAFDSRVLRESVLENGSKVGDLAMGLFGAYTEVPYGDLKDMLRITRELLAAGTPVIAEASFSADSLFCSVDILRCLGDNRVEIYEVKSSTAVHEIYLHDVAFQTYVLELCGFQVTRCCVVHLNGSYERHGDLELSRLFTAEDVTAAVTGMLPGTASYIASVQQYMEQTEEPADDIDAKCFKPYPCGFFDYCTRDLPRPNIFSVAGASSATKLKQYKQGCISFEDLWDAGALSANQRKQLQLELTGEPPLIDAPHIRAFMQTLSYPLYFLDFESFQPAVPLYDFSRPYEQIVFQYSLHWIEQPGGALQHTAFLAYPGADPRRAVAEHLCRDIPADACVTAYNMSFEKTRIKGLAALYPDLSEHLMGIHDHIQDLMVPFQKKWYCSRAMQGSYSIKYVLPALFPDDPALDYHNLEGVHNGSEASSMFEQMASMAPDELEKARAQLLAYCGLDTFAMVKVWEKLCEV